MKDQIKDISINMFGGLESVFIVLAILLVIGEPDLLDQFIAIAKNYSETIKCK